MATQTDFFEDLNKYSYYEPMAANRATEQAKQFRDIFEQPQREDLTRKLEQALADADAQVGRIRSNYVAPKQELQQRESLQRKYDLESAISRGAGRSGVVDYNSRKRDEYYTGQMMGMNAQQMAELNAVANQLGLVQRQAPDELRNLAEQGARLEAQELQRIRDLEYGRKMEYDQDMYNRGLQVFDRTMLSPLEQLQLYINLASVSGTFPSTLPDIFGKYGIKK